MFALSLVVYFVVGVLTVLYTLYWYQTKNFDYWKKRDVPFVKPHWFFGNVGHQILQRKTCTEFAKNLYNKFKARGFGGLFLFREPAIFICDPEMIETVLTKDFSFFEDRSIAANPDEVLSDTLFNAKGEKWRQMRHKLIPTFSSAKVKGMFDQIFKCAEYFVKDINDRSNIDVEIVVEPIAFTFATEVIASCAFGIQLMTNSVEGRMFRQSVDLIFETTPLRFTKTVLGILWPRLFRLLRIQFIPKTVKDFFTSLTKEALIYRKENNVKRNDFLQLLLTLKEDEEHGRDVDGSDEIGEEDSFLAKNCLVSGKVDRKKKYFTENGIASLIFNLLSAGVKPAAATITYAFFEIAKNQEVQQTLQEEVYSCIKKQGGLNYHAVKSMTYLDQIIQEVHRIYPFSKVLTRMVTDSYQLPGTNLVLERGTVVYIPVSAIHMDPDYYPSPEQFQPERFSGNNFKPSFAFMPYGNGPRICTGIRFSVLMMKVCIARVVANYSIELEMQLPIEWDNKVCTPEPRGGVRLSFRRRGETLI